IRVRWQGRVNYNSAIIPVGDPPGKRLIPIPRLEVIDNIGRSVEVGYSVKEKGVGETIESDRLTLHIDPQAVHPLPAPSYSASKVTVNYGGQTGYTVRVRWVGVTTRDTETQDVTTGQANVFNIPSAWISENSGKTVLINYSIVRKNSSEQRMFSQVLRVNVARAGL
ncbi:Ig-like domain repeat protein, partial [Pseudomonas sp. JL2]|nr:Ig-like domain repeat protein [Pseudomonas sp. JL2]